MPIADVMKHNERARVAPLPFVHRKIHERPPAAGGRLRQPFATPPLAAARHAAARHAAVRYSPVQSVWRHVTWRSMLKSASRASKSRTSAMDRTSPPDGCSVRGVKVAPCSSASTAFASIMSLYHFVAALHISYAWQTLERVMFVSKCCAPFPPRASRSRARYGSSSTAPSDAADSAHHLLVAHGMPLLPSTPTRCQFLRTSDEGWRCCGEVETWWAKVLTVYGLLALVHHHLLVFWPQSLFSNFQEVRGIITQSKSV